MGEVAPSLWKGLCLEEAVGLLHTQASAPEPWARGQAPEATHPWFPACSEDGDNDDDNGNNTKCFLYQVLVSLLTTLP